MPASSPGTMGGSVREPALSVALWLSWGAVLGAVTCAVALLIQQTELQSLRREVSRLQRSAAPSQKCGESPWQSFGEQVGKGRCESGSEGRTAEGSQGSRSAKFQVVPEVALDLEVERTAIPENQLLNISRNILRGSQCPG